jgi:hypothetical protein
VSPFAGCFDAIQERLPPDHLGAGGKIPDAQGFARFNDQVGNFGEQAT